VSDPAGYGDPLTAPFWEAAARKELVVQRCTRCGSHQLYPRPFCLACNATTLEWVKATGAGTVYTRTIVRVPVTPELVPPYAAAIVELDEGPRMTTTLTDIAIAIGDRVQVAWREREGLPPFPVFERA
jgi:uncharacterized OB-fold protein